MNENGERLHRMMKDAGLTRQVAADLLCVKIETVHNWLRPEGNKAANNCPDWAPVLLEYRINDRAVMRKLYRNEPA